MRRSEIKAQEKRLWRMTRDQIDQAKAGVDIVEVIGNAGVDLRPSGQSLVGLCPFHQEKSGSFHVWPEESRFHCFGCGRHGDIFDFLRLSENITFKEAVTRISGREFPAPNFAVKRTFKKESSAIDLLRKRVNVTARMVHALNSVRFELGISLYQAYQEMQRGEIAPAIYYTEEAWLEYELSILDALACVLAHRVIAQRKQMGLAYLERGRHG